MSQSLSPGAIIVWELLGTAVLLLLGNGVVANVVLRKNNGFQAGTLFITFGWGFAVFAGASIAAPTGAHLNPAVTLGLAISGKVSWTVVPYYLIGEMLGAILGAVLCWLTYKLQFDDHPNPEETLGIFSTAPQIRNKAWNLVTEIIGTFVLVGWILFNPVYKNASTGPDFGNAALGYAGVAFVVLVIGISLGGPTGYAINPARDLGPRLAYAFLLPIKGKRDPDWGYSWVPVVGPLVGAALAAVVWLGVHNLT
ncbi:glycerol uptake facilitator protein [Amycolatopsis echigonensis]|uniref:Glycerol uptake facilitator protein n=1 Tax=Amycolatopsis echigonensis TaxID=2576905 RepID=A0A2N3WDB3_9PSEU|nr:glycerol uptake facilitator protein [Amycolatopsis niigatensis]